jgi:hypothetical protein
MTCNRTKESGVDLQIEKGIPVPEKGQGKGVSFAQFLRGVEVGDSFLFPKAKRASLTGSLRLASPAKFTSRSVDETNVRVWRIE